MSVTDNRHCDICGMFNIKIMQSPLQVFQQSWGKFSSETQQYTFKLTTLTLTDGWSGNMHGCKWITSKTFHTFLTYLVPVLITLIVSWWIFTSMAMKNNSYKTKTIPSENNRNCYTWQTNCVTVRLFLKLEKRLEHYDNHCNCNCSDDINVPVTNIKHRHIIKKLSQKCLTEEISLKKL
jgi:hypothetical protein